MPQTTVQECPYMGKRSPESICRLCGKERNRHPKYIERSYIERKLGMRRITEEEFILLCDGADRIEFKGFTKPETTKTRVGAYWTLFKGLAPATTWFVGIALDESIGNLFKYIIEDVS